MNIFLAWDPDSGVELTEQESVVACLPAVHHFVGVRFVHPVVYTLVRPQLAALWLGHSLRPDAPVSSYERGYGEKQREEVQAKRQKGPGSAAHPHCLRKGWGSARRSEKFMCAK